MNEGELSSEEILNRIMEVCIQEKASDVHLDPKEDSAVIQFRINGLLQIKDSIPLHKYQEILSKIKIACNLRIDDHITPKDGSFTSKINTTMISFRVSILPTRFGENVVMRAMIQGGQKSLDDIGIEEEDKRIILLTLSEPGSIAIVMGPTGSGKTTTLYALLNELKSESRMAISIEDPIESYIEDVRQIQIGSDKGFNFGNALRAALRQDPDIILVGEIRDYDTAILAFQAALTGHVVLTSIHAYSSLQLIPRLLALGVPQYLIDALKIISINQRLVECPCEHCSQKVNLVTGCEACNFTGVGGRALAYEISGSEKSLEEKIMELKLFR